MQKKSARSGGLDRDISIFISEDYENELSEQNLFILKELTKQDKQLTFKNAWLTSQEDFNRDYIRQLLPFKHLYAVNTSLFRTPQELVIVSHGPERQFVFRLIEHSRLLSAWVKSSDTDFYGLDYEYWKSGKDRVRRSFNPDFFIKIVLRDYIFHLPPESKAINQLRDLQDTGVEDLILVVEIKDDDDNREETRAKGFDGEEHFVSLNRMIQETNPIDLDEPFRDSLNHQYVFYLLRPADYPAWFSRLTSGLFIFDLKNLKGEGTGEHTL